MLRPKKNALSLFLVCCALSAAIPCFAQPVQTNPPGTLPPNIPALQAVPVPGMNAAEICGNGLDDDGNGLTDDEDFACYYSNPTGGCIPSKIIWGNSSGGLYWVNPVTGASRYVGNNGVGLSDIAWASNGQLYGMNGTGIYQLNPATGLVVAANGFTAGYSGVNAMVGDDQGNLFLTVNDYNVSPIQQYVVRFNIASHQFTPIVNLSASNLGSAGDLTFLGGFLYLSCGNNRLARINPTNGSLTVLNFTAPVMCSAFGMMTLGDGYLYITNVDKLYRVDMTTLQATLYYTFPFAGADIPFGLSTYSEHCNAPSCSNPSISVIVPPGQGNCITTGIGLQASGTGIIGQSDVEWTLPDGTKASGLTLQAKQSGIYKARYHNIPDNCGHDTSFTVTLDPPLNADLGPDTVICRGTTITLQAKNPSGIAGWLWQDGSTGQTFTTSTPGVYTLRVGNACGVSLASRRVDVADPPQVQLQSDTAICPGSGIKLYNLLSKQSWDSYTWSTASTADTITVSDSSIYWLEMKNACGHIRDSVVLHLKDSCTCFPVYPRVSLPADKEVCSFDTTLLINAQHVNGFRYKWQSGSTAPEFYAYGPGIYWVDVSTWCGTVRDSVVLGAKRSGCERMIRIPNAFNPYNHSANNIFKPVIIGPLQQYEFSVYNRWGQQLFHTTNRNLGWDGRISGQLQSPGVFAWLCRYRFTGMPEQVERGTVLLVQ
ncbi:MAG: gliding motility-associated C-terminal domain-containing protein [Bacteroidetes bacterium]|nr:gliding motility-associated C-terminal domain-containing protein [Bacteroidota bacterium]